MLLNSGLSYTVLPTLLHIETSNTVCSVCISANGEVVAMRENTQGNQHASLLTPFIEEVLAETGLSLRSLDAVSLSEGPGSYTGLRIGASAAKAICYTTGKPLIAVGTLQAMVAGYIKENGTPTADTIFCPMVDARRMEVYAGLYTAEMKELAPPQPWIVPEHDFWAAYPHANIVCLGNGAAKAATLALGPNIKIAPHHYLSSANMVALAEAFFQSNLFVDVAYFEPKYLKTTPLLQS